MADELKARGLWLPLGWSLICLVIYLSLATGPIELPLEQGDKLSHVLAYLVLMSWFANLYTNLHDRLGFAIGFVLLGIGLEFVQGFVGYRSFETADMGANAAGVAIGWFLATPRMPNYLGVAERLWQSYS